MDRLDGRALVVAVAVLGVACQPPAAPSPPVTVNVNQTQVVNQTIEGSLAPGQTAQPANASGCLPVVRLGIQIPLTIAAGTSVNLDATPHSAPTEGNGQGKRSDACNLADGIEWTAGPASICSVSPLSGDFTPNFRAISPGTCAVTATVKGVSASGFVTVQ